jgi:hypothetical protein
LGPPAPLGISGSGSQLGGLGMGPPPGLSPLGAAKPIGLGGISGSPSGLGLGGLGAPPPLMGGLGTQGLRSSVSIGMPPFGASPSTGLMPGLGGSPSGLTAGLTLGGGAAGAPPLGALSTLPPPPGPSGGAGLPLFGSLSPLGSSTSGGLGLPPPLLGGLKPSGSSGLLPPSLT